jgi:DNA-binding LytR/AlgR family response regulator
MRYFHKLQNQFWKPVVNLDKVRSISRAFSNDVERTLTPVPALVSGPR